ncbi:uncharacterized protein LOC103697819 [Phoenix dactylifera]|uniref:Uncharacterized protein LOC103697819 n=1 Tax=Phoenix dactylifera TaxID=42345 RepID=A0A8B7BIW9_PHODC|nr:uncharacterized protein LOC103697819 [Phoenix dactylifera]XP_038989311.1 uncharacterized protein LOC103697819 [Phoenix dactylifera]XP_038989312.1 uncharacterized protein LOC103697819 [Phoenix dactylifera]
MECNRDEALRAKEIAEGKFNAKDIVGAKKFALKAQNLFPSLEGITQMIATFDVYLASEMKVNGESDWYAILCLDASADEETMKKQHRKLALQLHPDKNKSIGAEGAFKLISEAWSVLSDNSRKMMYDQKRNVKGFQQKVSQPDRDHSVPNSSNGFYSFANNTKSSKRARKSTSGGVQSSAPPPSRLSGLDTFWTSCNRCRMQYEYLRVYLNHNLLCPNCHQAFLAVETGVPTNGPNSSISCSTKQHQQNSNHNSSMKNAYGHGSNSTFPGTGHPGFHHGGNVDSYSSTNFQWGSYTSSAGVACSTDSAARAADTIHQTFERIRRKYEETQGTIRSEEALQSKSYVSNNTFNGSVSYDACASERSASKVGRPAKRRRNNSGNTGHGGDGTEQMATGTGKTVASELERANGVYGDYGKVRVTARQNNFSREYAQVDIRRILMEKAKAAIHKKLEDWNLDAAAKLAEKEMSKQKHNQKDKDNENVADRFNGVVADKTQSNDSRIGKKQFPGTNKDSADDCNVDLGKEATQPISIDVPDPDFNDFDKDRTESCFDADQVWAAYDNEDGMPRLYALVQKVISLKPFKIRMSFLNSKSNDELGPLNWVTSGFSKTCGDFRVGRYEVSDTVNIFSHRVRWEKGPRGVIKIIPRKGDIWTLYKNWSPDWNKHTPDDVIYKYEMVEVLNDYDEEHGVCVTPLLKVAGFKTVFHRHLDPKEVRMIPREEMFRFSHRVPSYLLTGEEADNAPKGCRELDPAATPFELLQVITEVKEDVVMETAE